MTDPAALDSNWWRGGVIYQIYPRSFQDSNADGIGDLPGITARMPYIASLGIDAIWISPFFTSPMKDFGYDVSDYCDVDPIFGTLADFDALIAAAQQHGVKVMIDVVLSHTSDRHPWFIKSREEPDGPMGDWYVWADAKPDGTAPNNWLSFFGGPAWQWDSNREQYYLHNFLSAQPDLNLHNTEVQDALLEVLRFWLDRGVRGFRMDTVNFLFADKALRDNPPLPPEERNSVLAPRVNPYNHQDHVYSKNQPETLEFLSKVRMLMEEYDATTTLGEIGDATEGLPLLGEYTRGTDRLHQCYAFEFLAAEPLVAGRVAEVLHELDRVASGGWAAWAFSNHDVMRHATRWGLTPAAQRLYATLMMCLPGSAVLYQGEELGLEEDALAYEDLQDPYGREFWPQYKGRDGCRTPMVWQADTQNAGFSEAAPWLPVGSENQSRAVDVQEADPGAQLHHYRRAIALRKAHPALRGGTISDVCAEGDVLHFRRSAGDETLFCAFNMSDTPSTHAFPDGAWDIVGQDVGSAAEAVDGGLHLGPWQVCLARRV
ncbi:alpha-amylase family glycosyl hydrolase [Sulfitobacter sp. S190]|uniref:alpha-amylase family glycosyl hydrolase n=1 Tax=Sulfitobacter sp. S190 TaxID=2867022 RepID=UPI0021A7D856|nr:alpha-amylase family glycosyl hydrolase [Sulfitobacter sp. S190]UWR21905.1 DUF3459 domain-containing protein [Sulfitobacter sp. S190]